jgi:hypothetical protein
VSGLLRFAEEIQAMARFEIGHSGNPVAGLKVLAISVRGYENYSQPTLRERAAILASMKAYPPRRMFIE